MADNKNKKKKINQYTITSIISGLLALGMLAFGFFLPKIFNLDAVSEFDGPGAETMPEITAVPLYSAAGTTASDNTVDSSIVSDSETTTISDEEFTDTVYITSEEFAETTTISDTDSVERSETAEESTVEYYTFRSKKLYDQHYEKHGKEFGNITKQEYLDLANELINSKSDRVLHKYSSDNDYMYFNQDSNYFLVLSEDGYIRTFFIPNKGIEYWNRQ